MDNMPHGTKLTSAVGRITLLIAEDGRDTHCTLVYGDSQVVAEGSARRRKGDPENALIGRGLATARVFANLAEQEQKAADRFLEG